MEPASITWQLTLQLFGGAFIVVSLFVFGAMAFGRDHPDYKQAFVAVWMLTLPITAAWAGVPLLFVLLTLLHHPALLLAVVPAVVIWWNWPVVRRLLRRCGLL